MKIEKNKTEILKCRISDEEKHLLSILAMQANMSVSQYLRMLVTTATTSLKIKLQSGAITYDNLETLFDNKLQYRNLFKK